MISLLRRLKSLWRKEQTVPTVPPAGTLASEHPASPVSLTPPGNSQSVTTHGSDLLQPVSEEQVYDALRQCRDPEIPVNIVDLGLVYDVRITAAQVKVKMTLTTQGCGMGGYITQEAEDHIRALPGVQEAKVEIVWDPPWNPSMISTTGRKTLGLPEE